MVDDTMEISSDHGHNDEQGDIDIDLDLSAGPGDEDFILEDATSQVDFGNNFHLESSTVMNDDIMVDDDNASYQMEDAELLDEETEHIIEQESMSLATDGDASYYGVHSQVEEQAIADDTNGIPYEEYDATKDESLAFNLQQDPEVVLPDDDVQGPEDSDSKITDGPTQATPAQGSQTSSPSRHSLPPTAPTEPRSPPVSVVEPGPNPSPITHDHTNLTSPHDADDSSASISPIVQNVVVVYREVEYALFSTSDHDDPDLYFLSDMSIAEKPLNEFFGAIRDVIRGDLVDEDELCIVVDSLGLQVEEVSSFVQNVTLLQVLSLHAKLSENDGLESTGGCHIILKTRTSFSRRFLNLSAAAAEGKGLSEFAYWDDQSIGLDDSEDPENSKYDFESTIEGQELGEAVEDYDEQQQYEHTESNGIVQESVSQDNGQDTLHIPETKTEDIQHTDRPEVTGSGGDANIASPKSAASKSPQKTQNRDSDVDEDGDLIDYSDEEDAVIEKRKAVARHTDNGGATEEFEKRDELLRRRSLDRRQSSSGINLDEHKEAADEAASDPQKLGDTSETKLRTEEDHGEHEPHRDPVEKDEYTDENEIGYEVFHTEESEDPGGNDDADSHKNRLEYGADHTEDDGLAPIAQVDTEDDESNALLEHYEEGKAYADADSDHGYAAEQGANYENVIANFENDELEFEVGGVSFQDDSKQDNDLLEPDERNGSTGLQETSMASSLDVIETAESSVTMGADEIQYEDDLPEETNALVESEIGVFESKAHPGTAAVVEQKDEIDYEDDDEEAELSLQSPALVPEAQGSQNANGKRSISDVESDDTQTLQTTDAKRPRS